MSIDEIYESVRNKMGIGPIAFPKHKKVLEFLKQIWNQEEIQLLDHFDGSFQFLTARKLSKKANLEKDKVKDILKKLAGRGTIIKMGGQYALLTIAPGLYEHYILTRGDTEENYQKFIKFFQWAILNLFPQVYRAADPPIWHPKLPLDAEDKMIIIDEAIPIKNQQVIPGELVDAIIEKSEKFVKLTCQCRLIGKEMGNPCKTPDELGCLLCGMTAKMILEVNPNVDMCEEITKDEAIQYIRDCEKAGLVHMGINSGGPEAFTFFCNCCSCHCLGLSGMKKLGVSDYGKSNFQPRIIHELCSLCNTCVIKCPMEAIIHQYPVKKDLSDEKIIIMTQKCIGCGVCAANCPKEAIKLVKISTDKAPPTLHLGGKSIKSLIGL